MGRRKRNNYQSIGEIKNDQAIERMAGDPLVQDALDYLANNGTSDAYVDAAVQDAMEYLPSRRAELDLMGGGKTRTTTEEMVESLARLRGNVPAPIFRKLSNGTERTHVEYAVNPVTGQTQVVPIMDPDGSGKVIKTTFGQAGIDRRFQHQAEPAMMNAIKLLGLPTVENGNSRRGAADLLVKTDDGDKRIDVMVDFTDQPKVNIPAYTSLVPMQKDNTPLMDRTKDGRKAGWVKNHINQRMQQGMSSVQAVESLVKEGVIGFDDSRRFGKLMRGDERFTPKGEDFYDALIMPGYSDEVLRGPVAPKDVPVPPNSIRQVNLAEAVERLNSGIITDVKMNQNYSQNNKGYERLQVKPSFARRPENGITNMVQDNPILQQLLDVKTMRAAIQ